MDWKRISWTTWCVAAVILATGLPPGVRAEGDTADAESVDSALREVLRSSLPRAERLAAAQRALAGKASGDPETGLEAGLSLLPVDPETGLWLLVRARDAGFLPDERVQDAVERVDALLESTSDPAATSAYAAAGLLVGRRSPNVADEVTAAWPPSPAVRATLERDLLVDAATRASIATLDQAALHRAVEGQRGVAAALDEAERDDVTRSRDGLDRLVKLGAAAVEPLAVEVSRATGPDGPPGRWPRACRAAVALGVIGDHRATPALLDALDAPDGWLQVAAATALGDLGDPAAVIPLCRKITYRGDVLRPRDQWVWPGEGETTIPGDQWPTIDYFVVDCAAADSLLRLGVRNAIGWLIRNKLDPKKSNFRIRVLQDAWDALRRVLPEDAPRYNTDAGLPQRQEEFEALTRWWDRHRHERWPVGRALDETNPELRAAARSMVEQLRGRQAGEQQMAQETCELLGPAATPVLLQTLDVAESTVLRAEILRALGFVDDPRAIDRLLELFSDASPFLRSRAAESLGAYLDPAAGTEPGRILDALLAGLDDPESAVAIAAMQALVAAPVSDRVRRAVQAHDLAAFRARFGADDREYSMAYTVNELVQLGPKDAWPQVKAGLESPQRYLRLAWWDLLRRALSLPHSFYAALIDPSTRAWEPIDEKRVLATLAARRAP